MVKLARARPAPLLAVPVLFCCFFLFLFLRLCVFHPGAGCGTEIENVTLGEEL